MKLKNGLIRNGYVVDPNVAATILEYIGLITGICSIASRQNQTNSSGRIPDTLPFLHQQR